MRQFITTRLLYLVILVPIVSTAQRFKGSEIARYRSEAKKVTIIRDSWGVPHIYGHTDADAVFGLMYTECEG